MPKIKPQLYYRVLREISDDNTGERYEAGMVMPASDFTAPGFSPDIIENLISIGAIEEIKEAAGDRGKE